MTQSIAFIRCCNKKEALRIKQELQTPVYKFVIAITRYGNFNNQRILQNLPIIKNFKLNKEEKEIINKFNRKFYG